MGAEKVIVDTDPAIGYAFRDVDDGLALLYLLAFPDEFEVIGVTTVFGNASLARATAKAREVLELARRTDIPLAAGAQKSRRLGIDTPASRLLSEATSRYPGEVTVLALGPLTNVATAGLRDEGFYRNVGRLVIMGGALEEGFGIPLISPLEFNFFSNPAAADAVLDARCEKVVITADLCRQVVFTRRELSALFSMRNPVATYLYYRTLPWLRLNQVAPFLPWKGGFVPWDVVAAVYLRRPDLFGDLIEQGKKLKEGKLVTGQMLDAPERSDRPTRVPTRLLKGRKLLEEFLVSISRY